MELLVRLILLPPLLMAAFNGMMGLFAPGYRKQEWVVGGLALVAVAVPFAVTCALFFGFEAPYVVRYFTWLTAGDLQVDFAYRIDQLSLLMTLVVTGVGSLIHLYSIGYMKGDPGFWRFFAYLNLFIFAMLNLVLAENLPVLFLGWEGVGLCSYLLIGFWYTDLKNSAAANKAFIVNRIGDFAFLLAMFIVFQTVTAARPGAFGLDFTTLLAPETLALFDGPVGFWVCLLFFIGATGKSAQIPLFVWLPDAMAGPTPVSALIHAATMVTSGLYLLARLSALVLLAPGAMQIIAVVGALTAIMAATVAMTQNDIKKVLAYSTVSQLGYMFLAAGVGAYFVAIFHVMTHAFFKACLFLGSGSVIHSMHHVEHELEHKGLIPGPHGPGTHDTPLDSEAANDPFKEGGAGAFEEDAKARQARPARGYATLPYDGPFDAQDMRTMGGLKRYMPSTRWTFLIATLAIAGIPGLAGFFSKDEILFKAFEYGYDGHLVGWIVWIVGLVTALLTAIYMTRAYLLTFEGDPRWPDALDTHPHESPWTMTVPLWVLAGLSVVGGFLGLPPVITETFGLPDSWIHHWLGQAYGGPVAELIHEDLPTAFTTWMLLGVGALIAIAGVAFAWVGLRFGPRGPEADRGIRRLMGFLYRPASRKWYWDEAYDAAVVDPIVEGSRKGLAPFDKKGVDGAVMGMAGSIRESASRLRRLQTGVVQTYAFAVVLGVLGVVALLLFT
ncbi:NADH-quinone oxidoreductase subunit L [Rubrivirga sp. S365]|uniref:NADH-quinone oxidoreductase subunit L n=1 Tax=Rubrivirga sp. S365 TaxID=3076080 RepID=UPI0028C87E39|nr:NADH-quinone oxidoreductase subunit L [Rubrivirga sp. S365]MDT7857427.1 NADH-quinone oxidoreductase subunit L [Rubrivirga sp. S365]